MKTRTKPFVRLGRGPCLLLLSCGLWVAAKDIVRAQEDGAVGAPVTEPVEKLSETALEELVAPIALYPDDLIAQILPASTYPLEVVQAARFLEKNKGKVDEETIKTLEYDPSILALMHYPEVIKKMNDDLDWTTALGDAVVAQQEDVLAAVQRFRAKADSAGNLVTNEQVRVVKEKEIIQIVPADPQAIYVPSYDPQVVVVRQEVRAAPIITFGVGLAMGHWLAYGCHWGHYHGSCRVRLKVEHRSYWAGVRPGWGAAPYWRPDAGRRAAYRHGTRHGARAGYRAGYRHGTAAGGWKGAGPVRPGGVTPSQLPSDRRRTAGRPSQLPTDRRPGAGNRRPGGVTPSQLPSDRRRTAGRPSQLPTDRRPGAGDRRPAGVTPSQLPSDRRQGPGAGRPSQLPSRRSLDAGARARPSQLPSQGPFGGYESGRASRLNSQRGAASRARSSGRPQRSAPARGGRSRGGGRSGRRGR